MVRFSSLFQTITDKKALKRYTYSFLLKQLSLTAKKNSREQKSFLVFHLNRFKRLVFFLKKMPE